MSGTNFDWILALLGAPLILSLLESRRKPSHILLFLIAYIALAGLTFLFIKGVPHDVD